MQASVTTTQGLERRLEVAVPGERVAGEVDQRLNNQQQRIDQTIALLRDRNLTGLPRARLVSLLKSCGAPQGEGDIVLDYHSTYFAAGAVVSLAALIGCVALLAVGRRRAR